MKTEGLYKLNNYKGEGEYWWIAPTELPQARALWFQSIVTRLGLGLDKDLLVEYIDKIRTKLLTVNSANLEAVKKELVKELTVMELKADDIIQPDLLLAGAAVLVVEKTVDQFGNEVMEDPEKLDFSILSKRLVKWNKNDYDRTFFLTFSLKEIMGLKGYTPEQLQTLEREINLKSLTNLKTLESFMKDWY